MIWEPAEAGQPIFGAGVLSRRAIYSPENWGYMWVLPARSVQADL